MMTILEHELLQTINRDGVRWLDPAHPAYADTLAAADDGCFENVITAWCQCGEQLTQSTIEAVLNRTVQP